MTLFDPRAGGARDLGPPEQLLGQRDWVRALARRLVADRSQAEDLAQEAWVRALRGAPGSGWPMRSWLGGVLRNLARERRREAARRESRERAAARDERLPSAADALERIQRQKSVVEAVLALDEPYRSTIVLRFYENLPPRAIARREGVPVATVKTRLARALAQLRARLDREHGGDGRSWALFLLPLATVPRGLVPTLAGALAVSTLVKIGLASAALVFGVLLWSARREHGSLGAVIEDARASTAVELPEPTDPAAERAETPAARESVPPTAVPTPPPAPPEPAGTISGRVIDFTGLPIAGVELGIRGSNGSQMDGLGAETFGSALWTAALRADAEPLAISGADGRYSFELPAETWGRVVSQDERWETVLASDDRAMPDDEQVVVVAPRFRLRGTVRDGSGVPLAGAELCFGVPRTRVNCPGSDLDDTLAPGWAVASDAQGRFAFERLPAVPGALLRVRLEPHEVEFVEREVWSDDELEIVLERPAGAWLEGFVEARGAPVAGAVVALGTTATKTDDQGGFQLHLEGLEKEQELCAAAAGFLPARLSGDLDEDGSVRWPPLVVLELSGEPLALEGTVVDAAGEPLQDQEVWIVDGRTTVHDEFPFQLESILAGKRDLRHGTKTDPRGRFRIGGLEPHEYHLRVIDPRTALVTDTGPYQAGRSDLLLRQPTDELWPVVRGVVVSRAGTPVPGLRVSVERDADLVGVPDKTYLAFQAHGARAETDEDGAFELHDVPRNGVHLSASGMEVVDPELELGPEIDPLDLRVVVDLWVRLEVHAGSRHPTAEAFAALDAAGEAVMLRVPMSGGIGIMHQHELVDGRSPVVSLGDQATTIVLYGGGAELARLPLALRPGQINLVEF